MIVVLCIVGYLFLGALTTAITSYVDNDDITKDDFYIAITLLWPLYIILMMIWGVGVGLLKLAAMMKKLITKFINWLRRNDQ